MSAAFTVSSASKAPSAGVLPWAATALIAWLLVHPYAGLRHDGVLYLGQVLHQLGIGDLQRDVFFAHGSQQAWSLYAALMAPLYQHAGIDVVSLLVLIPAQLAFAAAIWHLLAPLKSAELRWAGLLVGAVMQHLYGGLATMSFGENFLTARTLAEPLSLWALAAMAAHRPGWAGLVLLAAMALHPLVALPALVICWLLAVLQDRRWAFLALLALPMLALAAAGIEPFASLLRRYAPPWWALVDQVNAMVVLANWTEADWQSLLFDFGILVVAWRLVGGPLGRLAACTATMAAALLSLAGLGADLLHNVLLTQLQLWRGLWIAHLLALLLLPAVLLHLWRLSPTGRMSALAMAVMATAAGLHVPVLLPVAAWVGGHAVLAARRIELSRPVRLVSMSASVALIVVLGLAIFLQLVQTPADETAYLDTSLAGKIATAWPLPLALAACWLLLRWPSQPRWRMGAGALLAVALCAATLQWDRRSAWITTVENGLHVPHPFQAHVPAGAQVYWHNDFVATWVLLKRPSYFSKAQGAGLLFNEATAADYGKRWREFADIRQRRLGCETLRDLAGTGSQGAPCSDLLEADVSTLCQHASLDFVITPNSFMRRPITQWSVPGAQADLQHHYLYACSQFR